MAFKLDGQNGLLLQYTKTRDQRMTDFGIPALTGHPVDVPAGTCFGSGSARQDETTTRQVDSFTATLVHHFSDAFPVRVCAAKMPE